MKCPFCAAAELLHDTADLRYAYDTEAPPHPDADGYFCPACESFIPYGDSAMMQAPRQRKGEEC